MSMYLVDLRIIPESGRSSKTAKIYTVAVESATPDQARLAAKRYLADQEGMLVSMGPIGVDEATAHQSQMIDSPKVVATRDA